MNYLKTSSKHYDVVLLIVYKSVNIKYW